MSGVEESELLCYEKDTFPDTDLKYRVQWVLKNHMQMLVLKGKSIKMFWELCNHYRQNTKA